MSRYINSETPILSAPVTSANLRNARNQPVTELGCCTPFQLISAVDLPQNGSVCVIGDPVRSLGIAKALIRRSRKPFLFIGPASDKTSAFSSLGPEWINSSVQQSIPSGNGAILLSKPYSVYYELCEYIEEWQDRFIVLHLSGELQIGVELMNLLPAFGQCLIICDSVPQSIRNSEAKTITPKELMKQMSCLLVFRAGAATKDLIEILPTYVYEKITDTFSINSHRGRSVFHPLRRHRGRSFSIGQQRTMEYNKNLFENGDLQKISEDGFMLVYNAGDNKTYLAELA